MKEEMDFCACETRVISDDHVVGDDATARPAQYGLCSLCGLAIERTASLVALTNEDASPTPFSLPMNQRLDDERISGVESVFFLV